MLLKYDHSAVRVNGMLNCTYASLSSCSCMLMLPHHSLPPGVRLMRREAFTQLLTPPLIMSLSNNVELSTTLAQKKNKQMRLQFDDERNSTLDAWSH